MRDGAFLEHTQNRHAFAVIGAVRGHLVISGNERTTKVKHKAWDEKQKGTLIIFACYFSHEYCMVVPAHTGSKVWYRDLRKLYRAQEAGFAHELVEQSLRLHQRLWGVKLFDFALVKHDNTIAVQDGVDTMCDCVGGSARLPNVKMT